MLAPAGADQRGGEALAREDQLFSIDRDDRPIMPRSAAQKMLYAKEATPEDFVSGPNLQGPGGPRSGSDGVGRPRR